MKRSFEEEQALWRDLLARECDALDTESLTEPFLVDTLKDITSYLVSVRSANRDKSTKDPA